MAVLLEGLTNCEINYSSTLTDAILRLSRKGYRVGFFEGEDSLGHKCMWVDLQLLNWSLAEHKPVVTSRINQIVSNKELEVTSGDPLLRVLLELETRIN